MTNERILFMNQPNILILHLDELRQDCLGCYGNPDIQTPNIDALAADGVTYQNHYTVYPVCTPSRYSLFQQSVCAPACCMGQPLYIALRLSDFSKAPA